MSLYLTGVDIPSHRESQSMENRMPLKEKIREDYLKFLIEKETKFANLENICTYYEESIMKKYNKFNENKLKIEKMEKEYDQLMMTISENLITNFVCGDYSGVFVLDNEIEQLKKQIAIKEHQYETYSNSKNRLYHTNFMLKKRIEDEIKYEPVNEKQLADYKVFNDRARREMNRGLRFYVTMKNYHQMKLKSNEKELKERADKMSKLEFRVEMVKKQSEETEKNLRRIKDKIAVTQRTIREEKKSIKINHSDYLFALREYHKADCQLIRVTKQLKCNTIEDVIETFNKLNEDYLNLQGRLSNSNKEITRLNNINSLCDEEYNSVKEKIKLKLAKEHLEMLNNLGGGEIKEMKTKIQTAIYFSSSINISLKNKIIFLQNVINFLLSHTRRMSKKSPFKMHNISVKRVMGLISDPLRELNVPFDEENDLGRSTSEFTTMMCLLFIQFSNSLFYMMLHSITNSSMENLDSFKECNTIPLYSRKSVTCYSKELQKVCEAIITRRKIYRKNEMDFLKTSKQDHKKKINVSAQLITQDEILNRFENNFRSTYSSSTQANSKGFSSCEERIRFIKNNSRRIKALFQKYQNNLVVSERDKSLMNTYYNKKKERFQKSKSAENIYLPSSLPLNQLKVPPSQHKDYSEYRPYPYDEDMEYDSEQETNTVEHNLTKEETSSTMNFKAMYQFFKNDKEKARIFIRSRQLRNFDLTYNKGVEKNKKEEFNDAYYNFMKAYLKERRKEVVQVQNRKHHAFTVRQKPVTTKLSKIKVVNNEVVQGDSGVVSRKYSKSLKRISCFSSMNIGAFSKHKGTKPGIKKMYNSKSEVNFSDIGLGKSVGNNRNPSLSRTNNTSNYKTLNISGGNIGKKTYYG